MKVNLTQVVSEDARSVDWIGTLRDPTPTPGKRWPREWCRRAPSFEAAHLDRWSGGATSDGLALLRSAGD
jgi:hypothetical protein